MLPEKPSQSSSSKAAKQKGGGTHLLNAQDDEDGQSWRMGDVRICLRARGGRNSRRQVSSRSGAATVSRSDNTGGGGESDMNRAVLHYGVTDYQLYRTKRI